jgi:hypothetical protein
MSHNNTEATMLIKTIGTVVKVNSTGRLCCLRSSWVGRWMKKCGQGVMTHTQSSGLCMAKRLAFVVAI